MKRLEAMISATLAGISDSSGASGVAVSKSGTAIAKTLAARRFEVG